ncbi:MAG TPA: filamentous hemagglutinin N-terminal domain-containing protein [Burkholderiaceae bacterium]
MKTNKKLSVTTSMRWRIQLSIKLLPMLIAGCLNTAPAWSNPSGAQIVNGQVSITNSGNVMTITNSPGAIINWQNFSNNAGEITRFMQQNANSSVLNRVVGQDPSQILGTLQSNGKVFLINPNGIVFGAGAQVNVNGLVASTLNLSNENFLAGKLNFNAGTSAGSISNQGSITTPNGGQVYLIAPHIENSGIITSPKGDVILAAGNSVQLVDSSSPDMQVVVSAPTDQAINLGQVIAQGGKIGIYGALINQRGTVNANSAVVGENGKIVFKASGDTLLEAGSITTATGAGKGGDIQILGDRVGLTGNAKIDASGHTGGGTVLIGGDYHGENASIQNAKRTYVGADTQIKADAIDNGDGGKVIVWSDETTRAYGSIFARGGAQGGNGGFVETSGKQNLDFHAKVDVSANHGSNGTLLLDPSTITITGGSGDGDVDGTSTFQGSSTAGTVNFFDAGPTVIYQSEIEGLTPGTNLILEATDYISTAGTFNNLLLLPINSNLTLRTRNASTDGTGTIGINLVGSTDGTNLTFKTQGTGTITLQSGIGSSPQAAPIQAGHLVTDGGSVTIAGSGNVTFVNINTMPTAPGIGGDVSITSSAGYIAISRNIDARGNSAGNGNVTLNAAGAINVASTMADVPIIANQLTMTANGGINDATSSPGMYLPVMVEASSLSATNGNNSPVNIANVAGNVTIASAGVTTAGGDITLFVDPSSSLTVAAPINAGSGNINLNAGSVIGSGGTITGSTLNVTSNNGIGHGTPLITNVGSLTANNSGMNTDINIVNTGALSLNDVVQSASGSTGNINIDNTGALTTASGTSVTSQQGSITLTAHSPLTINGTVQSVSGGNINLTAGATGSSADKLTIASTGVVNTAGTVALQAGDAIVINGSVVGGTVTQVANINGPTLSQCIANPALAGCASVLPTLSQCISAPTTAGCSVVLPSLATCTASPSTAGCSVVLPSLATCTASPSTAGCSAVLPSLATCTVSPSTAGCSVVLPSLATCTAAPSTAGCSAVLPSLATCIATPSAAGCSAVLPSLATCTASPSTAGCSVVLPSLATCTASPSTAGCSAILPSLATCTTNPATPGCAAVLPTLSQCTATPTAAGCSVVLPTLAQCTGIPTLQGCSVVLPPVSSCVSNPSAAGCAVVLPPIATQTPSNTPITQAINRTINLINTSTSTLASTSSGTSTSNTPDAKNDEKKDDKKDTVVASDKPGAKNDDAAKKMYCN